MPSGEIQLPSRFGEPTSLEVIAHDPSLLSQSLGCERPTPGPRRVASRAGPPVATFADVGWNTPALLTHAFSVGSIVVDGRLPERLLQRADEVREFVGGYRCQNEEAAFGTEAGRAAQVGEARVESRGV